MAVATNYHSPINGQDVEMQNTDTVVTISKSDKMEGSVLSFHNISYTVEVREGCCTCLRKPKKKSVLVNLSGVIKPGLNAIIGPTGSGKSSLLDVLAKRKDPNWLTGSVLFNGKPLPKNFKYLSGYVIQNDVMVATATVRETLWFCANLRLPTKVSHGEKKRRVEKIIEDLGLSGCADTKIGNALIRGISGGEMKRTSIGLELITEPNILFLDEPTTGLDASTANSVMALLKKLGNQGRTIVCSIHQPRYSIYRFFDSLSILSLGRLIYHGPRASALEYFEKLGYFCEEHNNPADFFLDVLHGDYESARSQQLQISDIEIVDGIEKEETGMETNVAAKLKETFIQSDIFKKTEEELQEIIKSQSDEKPKSGQMYATGFLHQMKILLVRTIKTVVRNPMALMGNIFLNIIIGLVFGLLYFQIEKNPEEGIQNRLGILFFINTNLLFSSINVVEIFVKERDVFVHEYISGYYLVVSYFLSKLIADLFPLRTIAPFIFCSITYWMVGLKPDAGAFFTFLLIVIMVGYSAVGIGLFYSSSFNDYAVATLCIAMTFIFSIIFSGLLVNVNSIMSWLSWLKYFSIARYGLVALSVNELIGEKFTTCGNITSSDLFGSFMDLTMFNNSNGERCIEIRGEEFLHNRLSIGASAKEIGLWDLWQNIVALAVIITVLYTLSYIQLRRIKKYS